MLLPRDVRNALHELIDRRELLAEDVFDPVLDPGRDLVVLRWPLSKAEE